MSLLFKAVGATALLFAASAQAGVIYSNDFGNVEQATDTSITATFNASSGTGLATFHLDGFNTLDGDNYWIDVFTLSVNGTQAFSGTWDLGGGGSNAVLYDASGAAVVSNYATVFDNGGSLDVTLPVALLAGSNTLTFSYASPTTFNGTDRAGFQGTGDEGWGLGQVTVAAPVPEPASAALLLAGLGALGFLGRRRRA